MFQPQRPEEKNSEEFLKRKMPNELSGPYYKTTAKTQESLYLHNN